MGRPLGRGSIVNVSSGHTEVSPGEFLHYSTSKHAVGGITGAVGGFVGAGAVVGLFVGTGGCLKLRILQSIAFVSTPYFLPR
jgi:NAD(P)-dependent dehydrogenase (short-subunit alcohol dehydrogenase family)